MDKTIESTSTGSHSSIIAVTVMKAAMTNASLSTMTLNSDQPLPCNYSGGPPIEKWQKEIDFYLNGIMTSVVIALGLVGNTLAVIVLTRRTMHTSTNCFLTALAIWDSVVLLITLVLICLSELSSQFFSDIVSIYADQ